MNYFQFVIRISKPTGNIQIFSYFIELTICFIVLFCTIPDRIELCSMSYKELISRTTILSSLLMDTLSISPWKLLRSAHKSLTAMIVLSYMS